MTYIGEAVSTSKTARVSNGLLTSGRTGAVSGEASSPA
jgi:hypothetical protein